MLSHAGKEAREVFKTLPWTEDEDRNKFDKVLQAFEQFCSSQRNILYERYGFWSLHQEEGETVDAYLTRLELKIDNCEYDKTGWPSAVKTEITRDKFVFGLIDDVLKERLLREVDLTLERAVSLAQHSESSKLQAKEMSVRIKPTLDCDEITQSQKSDTTNVLYMCGQCGGRHKPKECPAYGRQCAVCHKLNHFAKVCRSKNFPAKSKLPSSRNKNVFTVDGHASDSDSSVSHDSNNLFIDPLKIDGLGEHAAWLSTITTPNGNIICKLDTGAEASVLPTTTFNKLDVRPPLQPTSITLTAYGGSPISPVGTCELQCDTKDSQHKVKFYVVNVDSQPILGLRDCQKLGLIKRTDVISTGQLT